MRHWKYWIVPSLFGLTSALLLVKVTIQMLKHEPVEATMIVLILVFLFLAIWSFISGLSSNALFTKNRGAGKILNDD